MSVSKLHTGNGQLRVIGRCSQCGGVVSVPNSSMSTNRPVPMCESCGAAADITAGLPVVPTRGGRKEEFEKYGGDWDGDDTH